MELLSSTHVKAAFPELIGTNLQKTSSSLTFPNGMVNSTQFKQPALGFTGFVTCPKFVRSPPNAASVLDTLCKAEGTLTPKTAQVSRRPSFVSAPNGNLNYSLPASLSMSNHLNLQTQQTMMLPPNAFPTGQYHNSQIVHAQQVMLGSSIPNFVMNSAARGQPGQTSTIYSVKLSPSVAGKGMCQSESKKRKSDDEVEETMLTLNHSVKRQRRAKSKKGSMYKGVTLEKKGKKWRAKLSMNGNLLSLGSFDNEDVAAKVWSYMKLVLKCPNGRESKEGKAAFEKELPELNFPEVAVRAYDDLYHRGVEPDFFPKPKSTQRRRRKVSSGNENKTDSPVDIQKLIDQVKGKGKL